MAVVTVEEVSGRAAFKRFFEFAYLQYRDEPRWSAPVVAYERKRVDPHGRYFDAGDGEYFLARRGGVVAGRIAAHVAGKGDEHGWFGFFDLVDDAAVGAALIEQAVAWLRGRGCTTMTGPASLTVEEDLGVLVDGFDVAGTTGRPWNPPWYATPLEAAGLARTDEHRTWRLPPKYGADVVAAAEPAPLVAGRFADPRLVLNGIAAVPDLTPARGSAVALARRARRRHWEGCTIVRIDGDPSVLVPRVLAHAGDAGYEWVISPWSPDAATPPETIHARFTRAL